MEWECGSSCASQLSQPAPELDSVDDLECPRAPQQKPISMADSALVEQLRDQFRISPEETAEVLPHFNSQPSLPGQ